MSGLVYDADQSKGVSAALLKLSQQHAHLLVQRPAARSQGAQLIPSLPAKPYRDVVEALLVHDLRAGPGHLNHLHAEQIVIRIAFDRAFGDRHCFGKKRFELVPLGIHNMRLAELAHQLKIFEQGGDICRVFQQPQSSARSARQSPRAAHNL
jgi:hypothetical protein